jgi:hypothetical protein
MKRRIYTRISVFLLAAVLLFAILPSAALGSGTAQREPVRAIAIIFDNSGSMYKDYTNSLKTWCQAIYAMQVFAAMLNPGDQLRIFPMNRMEVNGKEYSMSEPLVIRGAEDVDSIRNIYTTDPGITPINAVYSAMEGLEGMAGDEKWLILLTDGAAFFDENNKEMTSNATGSKLTELLSEYNQRVNVMYLGIDLSKSPAVPTINGPMRSMVLTAMAADVPEALSSMCNFIFQRDELPELPQYKTNESVGFDLPMKKLIVLVQGQDVGEVSLKNSGGTYKADITHRLKYGEKGAKGITPAVDRDLQGTMAIFSDIPAGNYDLSYSGTASAVSAYYEPEMELGLIFCDENGEAIPEGQEVYAGKYLVSYGLLDSNGDFTESLLLGNTRYSIDYELNGVRQPTITADGTGTFPLDLKAGDVVRALRVRVNYLVTPSRPEGYVLERTGQELGWLNDGVPIARHPAGALTAAVEGGRDGYLLHEMEEQGVYTIRLLHEGEPLTGEALDRTELSVRTEGPGDLKAELQRVGDGYRLRLKHGGAAGDTPEGEYRIILTGSYVNEEEVSSRLEKSISFTLGSLSHRLSMELERPQDYYVIKDLAKGEPLQADLTLDDKPLTDAEMSRVRIRAEAEGLPLEVEPVPGRSAWRIRIGSDPEPERGKYTITVFAELDDELGRPVTVSDEAKVQLERYPRWVYRAIRLGILLLILLFILGYVPPFKKYLPRKLKSKPTVVCQPNRRGVESMDGTGKYRKNTGSTLVPYKAETGTIRVVPRGVTGVPSMRVKAAGGNAMWLTNVKAFADKENITFNGASVQGDRRKPLSISAGTMINVSTEDFEYICIPNQ